MQASLLALALLTAQVMLLLVVLLTLAGCGGLREGPRTVAECRAACESSGLAYVQFVYRPNSWNDRYEGSCKVDWVGERR